jgi:hypothetical protein
VLFETALETSLCLELMASSQAAAASEEGWASDFFVFVKEFRIHVRNGLLSAADGCRRAQKLEAELQKLFAQKIESKSRLASMVAETSQRIIAPHTRTGSALTDSDGQTRNRPLGPPQVRRGPLTDIHHASPALKYIEAIDEMFIESQNESQCLASIDRNIFYVGHFDGKIERRDIRNPELVYRFKAGRENKPSRLRSMFKDKHRRLWVSTNDALSVFDRYDRIIFHMKTLGPLNKLFGHMATLWYEETQAKVLWWCAIDSIVVLDSKTFKKLYFRPNILKNKGEYPSDYTMIDGKWENMLILTMFEKNLHFHLVQPLKRRVEFNKNIPPVTRKHPSGYICVAPNAPFPRVVLTGTVGDTKPKALVSLYSFKDSTLHLEASTTVEDGPLMTRPVNLTESLVVAIMIRNVHIFEFKNNSISLVCRVLDVNRGENVNFIERMGKDKNDWLFVGNCGQIFRIKFKLSSSCLL